MTPPTLCSVVITVGSRPPTHPPWAPLSNMSVTQWNFKGTDVLNSGMTGGALYHRVVYYVSDATRNELKC